MHRFYLPPGRTSGDFLSLAPDDAHHAVRVLRLGAGNPVVILDGEGGELRGVVHFAGRQEVSIRVIERIRHPDPSTEVILVQAIAKAQAMDGIIHRAVELGCAQIQPLLTERSISRPDDLEAKRSKWQDMAIEAAKHLGAQAIELHTGTYAEGPLEQRAAQLARIVAATAVAGREGLHCHAGHGLTYDTVGPIAAIPGIIEVSIGHFLISTSVFEGLPAAIARMKSIIARHRGA